MLLGISPVRISFAGGGTDFPEYYDKFGGKVISTTISRFTYVISTHRNDKKFQIFSTSKEECIRRTEAENDTVIIPVIKRMAEEADYNNLGQG